MKKNQQVEHNDQKQWTSSENKTEKKKKTDEKRGIFLLLLLWFMLEHISCFVECFLERLLTCTLCVGFIIFVILEK
jgi:hypothetical protein